MAESLNWQPARNEQLTVSNTSQVVVKARGEGQNERTLLVIRNMSDDATKIITLNFGSQSGATSNLGIVLKQYEQYSENTDVVFKCWQGEVTAICAVANAAANLSIHER